MRSVVQTACPSEDELRGFAIGDVPLKDVERIAKHLADCADCEATLGRLDHYADRLLSDLGNLKTIEQTDCIPPSLVNVVTRVKTALLDSNDNDSDVALDHGNRLARSLSGRSCRIGRFELQAELGTGTFGHVFRARDLELDRTVALKVQRVGALASNDEVRRFLDEARNAAQLEHPGIVSLYDSGQTEDGVCFLVSQFIDGETLEQRLTADSYETRQAASFVAGLADTIQYAHDHGVIHRDIKPSNVIVDKAGRAYITDFGLAKRMAVDEQTTSDGRVMGTPAYMSPEQARGASHDVDARTDIYSLGVILYELLTDDRPFQGNHRMLLLQVLEDDPRPPRALNDRIPKELETICLKAMAKSASRRYQTAGELAADLRRFLRGEPIEARPVGRIGRLVRWCRRYPVAAGLLVAISLGSVSGFVYLSHLSRYFVEATALDSVRMETDMLEGINDFYSGKVIDKLDWEKVKVSRDYVGKDDTVPLPATLLIDAGEHISRGRSGMEVRLFSSYPFRMNGGPKDEFERRAIAELNQNPSSDTSVPEYHEFTSKDGRRVVRYARAQIMKESCVKCHNGDANSPKRDWKEEDLAGVLAITRPLDRDIERTRTGLQDAFIVIGAIGVLLLGCTFAFVLTARLRDHERVGT